MSESKRIVEALVGVSNLKPFRQGWVLWNKGSGYFKGLDLFAMNPHHLCESPKKAQYWKSKEDAERFLGYMIHSRDSYQVVKRVVS